MKKQLLAFSLILAFCLSAPITGVFAAATTVFEENFEWNDITVDTSINSTSAATVQHDWNFPKRAANTTVGNAYYGSAGSTTFLTENIFNGKALRVSSMSYTNSATPAVTAPSAISANRTFTATTQNTVTLSYRFQCMILSGDPSGHYLKLYNGSKVICDLGSTYISGTTGSSTNCIGGPLGSANGNPLAFFTAVNTPVGTVSGSNGVYPLMILIPGGELRFASPQALRPYYVKIVLNFTTHTLTGYASDTPITDQTPPRVVGMPFIDATASALDKVEVGVASYGKRDMVYDDFLLVDGVADPVAYAVEDATYAASGSDLVVSADVTKGDVGTAVSFAAAYDSAGNLLGISNAAAITASDSYSVTIPNTASPASVKMFVWNSVDGCLPLCSAAVATAQ